MLIFSSYVPETRAAAIINAATCNQQDVQSAINQAVDGDIVVVQAGTCTWTAGITISKSILLVGGSASVTLPSRGSTGAVKIIDGGPDGTVYLNLVESTVGHIEVRNLTFDSQAATHGSDYPTFHVALRKTTNGKAILIHHNTHLFSTGSGVSAYLSNTNRGVIYKNNITAQMPVAPFYRNTFSAIRCKNSQDLVSWESPSTLGTLDTTGEMNLYVEDNYMSFLNEGTDFDDSCRVVFRYNTLDNSNVLSHGWDSSPYGSRQVEVYNNTFLYGATGADGIPVNINQLINLRGGGVWAIHDNTIPDIYSSAWGGDMQEIGIVLYGIRLDQCYTGGYPMYHQQGQGYSGTGYITDPVYVWNNKQPNGSPTPNPVVYDVNDDTCGNNRHTSEFVQLNRDYFLAQRPNYTPYAYPHPLTLASTTNPTPLAGDLNNNHIVNSLDWSIMNSQWYTTNSQSDLNHDGIVNTLDWSIMNANWYKTW